MPSHISAPPRPGHSLIDLKTLNILVCDAQAPMRRMLSELFTDMGVGRVLGAAGGGDALVRLGGTMIDAIFVDAVLDDMDGIELVRQVRSAFIDRRRYLPIVLMMALPTAGRICEARDAGVSEIMLKPITLRALTEKLGFIVHEPRPFVESPSYFGPDRRRGQRPEYRGALRRLSDRKRNDFFV